MVVRDVPLRARRSSVRTRARAVCLLAVLCSVAFAAAASPASDAAAASADAIVSSESPSTQTPSVADASASYAPSLVPGTSAHTHTSSSHAAADTTASTPPSPPAAAAASVLPTAHAFPVHESPTSEAVAPSPDGPEGLIPDIASFKEAVLRRLAREVAHPHAPTHAHAGGVSVSVPSSSVPSSASSLEEASVAAGLFDFEDALPVAVELDTDADAGTVSGGGTAHRTNYAAASSGAVVLAHNPEMNSVSALLSRDADAYALSPCSARKWVVIGLSEAVALDEIVIDNEEKYSSTLRAFRLLGSARYPASEWVVLGNYSAANKLGPQRFRVNVKAFVSYIKLVWLSHHGNEFYCTWTRVLVHGSTVLEAAHSNIVSTEAELLRLNTMTATTASLGVFSTASGASAAAGDQSATPTPSAESDPPAVAATSASTGSLDAEPTIESSQATPADTGSSDTPASASNEPGQSGRSAQRWRNTSSTAGERKGSWRQWWWSAALQHALPVSLQQPSRNDSDDANESASAVVSTENDAGSNTTACAPACNSSNTTSAEPIEGMLVSASQSPSPLAGLHDNDTSAAVNGSTRLGDGAPSPVAGSDLTDVVDFLNATESDLHEALGALHDTATPHNVSAVTAAAVAADAHVTAGGSMKSDAIERPQFTADAKGVAGRVEAQQTVPAASATDDASAPGIANGGGVDKHADQDAGAAALDAIVRSAAAAASGASASHSDVTLAQLARRSTSPSMLLSSTASQVNVFATLTRKLKELDIDQSVVRRYLSELHSSYSAAIASLARQQNASRSELQELRAALESLRHAVDTSANTALLAQLRLAQQELTEVGIAARELQAWRNNITLAAQQREAAEARALHASGWRAGVAAACDAAVHAAKRLRAAVIAPSSPSLHGSAEAALLLPASSATSSTGMDVLVVVGALLALQIAVIPAVVLVLCVLRPAR